MMEQQERLQKTLDGLVAEDGVLGSALVSRDGIPVLSSFSQRLDQRTFSILVEGAMVATLMGAAEEAMEELEAGEIEHITIETAEFRMIILGASPDLLFLAITDASIPLQEVLAPLTAAVTAFNEAA